MRHLFVSLLLSVAVVAFAQEKKGEVKKGTESTRLHGYVVDYMCAKGMLKKGNPMDKAAKHSKECALEEACAASGFGLFYGDGKWVKFDDNGDKLAKAMFEKSKKEKDFMADIVGGMQGETFVVASLVESHMSKEEMKGKVMKKVEDAHQDHK